MVISGEVRSSGEVLNIVNIYVPNDAMERRGLWHTLLCIKGVIPGLWVFAGDFNEVRAPTERRNSEFFASHANAFNQFIEEADLVEYQMGGGMFTYVSDHGDKLVS